MIVVLPILIPLVAAVACLVFWNRPIYQRRISLVASAVAFGYSLWFVSYVSANGIQALSIAGWEARWVSCWSLTCWP